MCRSPEGRIGRSRRLAALAAAALAACAAAPDPELARARESWRGTTYQEVVAAWGPPARSVKSGELDNHTWIGEERATRAGGSGGGVGGVIFSAFGEQGPCERTLAFRDGFAVGGDWSGDPESCKRFAKRR